MGRNSAPTQSGWLLCGLSGPGFQVQSKSWLPLGSDIGSIGIHFHNTRTNGYSDGLLETKPPARCPSRTSSARSRLAGRPRNRRPKYSIPIQLLGCVVDAVDVLGVAFFRGKSAWVVRWMNMASNWNCIVLEFFFWVRFMLDPGAVTSTTDHVNAHRETLSNRSRSTKRATKKEHNGYRG